MHLRSRAMIGTLMMATLLAAGCVTINIYFPAAAAERAADRLIDDIWQLQGGTPAQQPASAEQQTQPATEQGDK